MLVLVTGGSRGIGAATARKFAAGGWDVTISYRTDAAAAADVVASCQAAGVDAVALRADVAEPAEIEELFASIGRLDALVINAGIAGTRSRVDQLTPARIQQMMAVNVTGALLCAREAILRMSTLHGGAGGVVVAVSSAAARLGSAGQYVDYAASKGAVDTMVVGLAAEVAAESIRVNGVRPGLIHTDIHASGGDPDRVRRLESSVPMGRGGEPEEVANAIAWLCSEEASYITGAILDVSGGR